VERLLGTATSRRPTTAPDHSVHNCVCRPWTLFFSNWQKLVKKNGPPLPTRVPQEPFHVFLSGERPSATWPSDARAPPPRGDTPDNVKQEVKGLDMVRRDWCGLLRAFISPRARTPPKDPSLPSNRSSQSPLGLSLAGGGAPLPQREGTSSPEAGLAFPRDPLRPIDLHHMSGF